MLHFTQHVPGQSNIDLRRDNIVAGRALANPQRESIRRPLGTYRGSPQRRRLLVTGCGLRCPPGYLRAPTARASSCWPNSWDTVPNFPGRLPTSSSGPGPSTPRSPPRRSSPARCSTPGRTWAHPGRKAIGAWRGPIGTTRTPTEAQRRSTSFPAGSNGERGLSGLPPTVNATY
jgi:hypothetical protein